MGVIVSDDSAAADEKGLSALQLGMDTGIEIPRIPDLACSLRGLALATDVPATSARGLLGWVSGLESRAVVLDALHPELRARSLDRSSRRDIAAVLKRSQLSLAGIDAFIPAAHFAEREHADRAVAAVLGAIELAHDLVVLGVGGTPVVSLDLPDETVDGVAGEIAAQAERHGVAVAAVRGGHADIGSSVDLDAISDAGVDPTEQIASSACVQARWGGPRMERRLDLAAIAAGLSMKPHGASCVLDLSRRRDVASTAQRAFDTWAKISLFG
jgi:hypothetical protein